MKALVLSDTHIPHRARDMPREIWELIEKVDLVFHAGDFTDYEFYLQLKESCPILHAVHGNMDSPQLFRELPDKKIVEIGGKRFGITHGTGPPWGIEKRALEKFEGEELDVLIFGHSHNPLNKIEGEMLFFNPGTPTDTIFSTRRSYGIIEIEEEKIVPIHYFID